MVPRVSVIERFHCSLNEKTRPSTSLYCTLHIHSVPVSFFCEGLGGDPNRSSSRATFTLLGAFLELKTPASSAISFSIFSAKLGGAFDVFSEKLSSKRASRDEGEVVSWSLPEAEGGVGDWAELEPEPELLRARLEGGRFPEARWTRF